MYKPHIILIFSGHNNSMARSNALPQKLIDGRTDLVLELVPEKLPATAMDASGTPLIRWCSYYGDVSAIRHLLKHGTQLEDLGTNYDLNGAVFHGHWQLTQFLLERGANPNIPLKSTAETPLHSALSASNRPSANLIVKLLLTHGADPNAKTKTKAETGAFMRDAYTKGETPLHRAAAFGNEETINLLINAGAEKDSRDMNGDSPLSWASWHLRPGKILQLLSFGAHRIHDMHVRQMQSDHGSGWGSGTSVLRLGKIHLEDSNNGD